jgi:hypothetical protein
MQKKKRKQGGSNLRGKLTHAHRQLVADARVALVSDLGVEMWPVRDRWLGTHCTCMGAGAPDLVGLVKIDVLFMRSACAYDGTLADFSMPAEIGRFFALEAKTGKGELSETQECWARSVRRHGGFASEFRSVEEALGALERCRLGESQ